MEQKNDNKWIEEAFKKAQPMIDGKTVEEFSKHMEEAFNAEFSRTMAAYAMSFGLGDAVKAYATMTKDSAIARLVQCFFAAGYKVRMEEEKKGGEK